jgi:hypothetical protein
MRPPTRPWSCRVLIPIVMLACLMNPGVPMTRVPHFKHAAVTNIANAQPKRRPQRNQRAVGLMLAIAVLLRSGRQ